ncbi:hypothetical protein SAMN05421842_10396 [Clostridium uliginosum]|uniref:Uncharacterized protein n=1 Tax=Clostridium uliginosum TaxID=119641 RepID=A0A1I1IW27_9CLOT|nr:hypothetical protein SAMN05421842_10396 [Clostridium uliginosum]
MTLASPVLGNACIKIEIPIQPRKILIRLVECLN